ncbi:MAG: GTPase Era [Candidatus Omnitrophica bacterium]|nr:GTPase Era [Candidatus Omnitrophota bacterium]
MRSGFVSILGKPNVGKSTLLNRLVGSKLAAVSRKPQTTRQIIRGILTESRGQIIFLDTPGLHKPKDSLGCFMVREATKTFLGADLLYWITEPRRPNQEDAEFLAEMKKQSSPARGEGNKPIFCLINKIDSVSKPEILPVIDQYQKLFPFTEIIPISALQGDQLDLLLEKTFAHLPEHEPYFPSDITSDQTERFIAGEMVREKIFRFTGEEIPYVTAVQIDEFKEEEAIIRIHAVIFTEKESQKAILIGRGGEKMKQIGKAAREDLERFFGKKVFLELWVKTLKNWKKDERELKRLGFQ